MFNALDELADNYDMCILAGDFNTYDKPTVTKL